MHNVQFWEIWYPDAAATGLLLARARIAPVEAAWVHAAPKTLAVTVRDGDDRVVARAERLRRLGDRYPMTRLIREGNALIREDRWPTSEDLEDVVILPGGEAGLLKSWWNASDGSEWRWQVEFCNRR